MTMKRDLGVLATASALLLSRATASAQKQGGILKIGHFDSPASMSMLEESTLATNRPMMGVFNHLVMFRHCQPCPAFNLALSFPTAHARGTAGSTASIQPRRASR